jgi:uncharacterized protein YlxP (DUF503 family)
LRKAFCKKVKENGHRDLSTRPSDTGKSLPEGKAPCDPKTDRSGKKPFVAISEVGDNDLWQRAQIGICMVSNDRRYINSSLDKVIDFIEKMHLVEMVHSEMEILSI